MASTTDPYRNFRFRLEISNIQTAGFSEATIPDGTVDMVEYREGTDPVYPRKLSGLTKFGSVMLKNGTTDSTELYDWFNSVSETGSDGSGVRRSVSIILVDSQGSDKARWDLYNCWPTKYEAGSLNASSNDVLIQSLELVVESMTRSS